jgi:DNA-binding NarL/FixJ family response regulator
MHILFVTPHLSDADLAQQRLQRSTPGVRVDACGVPDQARARLVTVVHDAVVVDVLAFGESGLQLIAECRARAAARPIVALTRTAGEDDVAMAAVAGASTCIAKESGWLEPLVEALQNRRAAEPVMEPVAPPDLPLATVDLRPPMEPAVAPPAAADSHPAVASPEEVVAPETIAPASPTHAAETPSATLPAVEVPATQGLAAQVDRLQHALDQEAAIRRDVEARARNLAAAHDADRQRWQLALRHLEERYAALTQLQSQRSDLEAAFESVEQRYMALLEERRRDLRRLEVLDEQTLRQRETIERLEGERDRLVREASAARESTIQAEQERARLAEDRAGFERERAELGAQLARATDDLRQAAEHGGAIQAALARAERDQQEAHAQRDALRRRVEADAVAIAQRDARIQDLETAVETAATGAREARAELERQVRHATDARPALAHASAAALATTSRRGRVLRATDAFARALGFESAAAFLAARPERPLPFMVDPDALARRLDERQGPVRYEAHLRRADGRSRWVVATTLTSPGGVPADTVEWLVHDVTDTARSRRLQRRVRRLEGACGLATSAGHALLDEAGDAAHPGAPALRQIVTYARQQGQVEGLNDLAQLLRSLEPAICRLAGGSILTRVHAGSRALLVEIDPDDAEHVFASTTLALREALPFGGSIMVTAVATDAEDAGASSPVLTPIARVAFTAHGHGMWDATLPSALLARIGEIGGWARAVRLPDTGVRIEIDLPLIVDLDADQ